MVDLIESIDGLAAALREASEASKKRKRMRDFAMAIGLIGQGTHAAKLAAAMLPKRHAKKLRRTVDVAGFRTIGPRGALRDPEPIEPGDTIYISPINQPGTGLVTKDRSRIPYGVAHSAVAAGGRATIDITVYEKLWLTDGNACDICEENSVAGWIPVDEEFPSGDWEPGAHPNCKCSLETRRVDD